MIIESADQSVRGGLVSIAAFLDEMLQRIKTILDAPEFTCEMLVEVTVIYNNSSYIYLYLEANDDMVSRKYLDPYHSRLYDNDELKLRMLDRINQLICTDQELERSRLAYIAQLTEQLTHRDKSTEIAIKELKNQAEETMGRLYDDQWAFLEKIGYKKNGASPTSLFYKISGQIKSSETRRKLVYHWREIEAPHLPRVAKTIDGMVQVRRQVAKAEGYVSPITRTLTKCQVDIEFVDNFLDQYLNAALQGHAALIQRVGKIITVDDALIDHFAYFMRQESAGSIIPLFNLDTCLSHIFSVSHEIFGLEFERSDQGNKQVIVTEVFRQGRKVGRINFDLWNAGGTAVSANNTLGIRNRAHWKDIVQLPEAYVCCRFQLRNDGSRAITFQNVHSLYHEFGHAINHLLVRERVPNRSGLEYLPMERIECLSMWFEKWCYHRSFSQFLPESDRDGLLVCQKIKRLEYQRTYVERAVTALLDFHVHHSPHETLHACYQRLDRQYGFDGLVRFTDFPDYFTWPMFMANPGANFSYLWGSAFSCQAFLPAMRLPLESLRDAGLADALESCFEFQQESIVPDLNSLFVFYDVDRWEEQNSLAQASGNVGTETMEGI